MAPAGCSLDEDRLVAQMARYARLGATAISITDRKLEVLVRFDANLDLELLRETIAIERQCCSFFTLDYDGSDRRLSISVDRPDRVVALGALLSAFRAGRRVRRRADRDSA